jgi:hypothetical protein
MSELSKKAFATAVIPLALTFTAPAQTHNPRTPLIDYKDVYAAEKFAVDNLQYEALKTLGHEITARIRKKSPGTYYPHGVRLDTLFRENGIDTARVDQWQSALVYNELNGPIGLHDNQNSSLQIQGKDYYFTYHRYFDDIDKNAEFFGDLVLADFAICDESGTVSNDIIFSIRDKKLHIIRTINSQQRTVKTFEGPDIEQIQEKYIKMAVEKFCKSPKKAFEFFDKEFEVDYKKFSSYVPTQAELALLAAFDR